MRTIFKNFKKSDEEISWATISIITPTFLDEKGFLKEKIDLGSGLFLCEPPEWINSEEINKKMSYSEKSLLEDSKCVFIKEYQANSLGDPDPNWNGKSPRSKQDWILEDVSLVCLALWLINPSRLSQCILYIHARKTDDKWTLIQYGYQNEIVLHDFDNRNMINKDEIKQAIKIFAIIRKLSRPSAIWSSIRSLIYSLTQPWNFWEGRFALLWIALEAIFGSNNELSFKMAQRIAFLIAQDRKEAKSIFNDMKESYVWRNKTVHGFHLKKLTPEESARIMYGTESAIRKSLIKILNDEEITLAVNGEQREDFLDSFIFR